MIPKSQISAVLLVNTFLWFSTHAVGQSLPGAESSSLPQESKAQVSSATDPSPIRTRFNWTLFLHHVCSENARATRTQKPQSSEVTSASAAASPERLPYESLIGISTDTVETMLSLSLTACRALQVQDRQYFETRQSLLQSFTPEELRSNPPPALTAISSEKVRIINQALDDLKSAVGNENFAKISGWVVRSQGIYTTRPPAGVDLPHPPAPSGLSTAPGDPETDLRIRYMFFLLRLGHEQQEIEVLQGPNGAKEKARLIAAGAVPQGVRAPYETMIGLKTEEVKTILSISLSGFNAIKAKEADFSQGVKAFHEKYTPSQYTHMQVPADLVALNDQRWSLVEQTVNQLRASLSNESFAKLDQWVTKHFGHPTLLTTLPRGTINH